MADRPELYKNDDLLCPTCGQEREIRADKKFAGIIYGDVSALKIKRIRTTGDGNANIRMIQQSRTTGGPNAKSRMIHRTKERFATNAIAPSTKQTGTPTKSTTNPEAATAIAVPSESWSALNAAISHTKSKTDHPTDANADTVAITLRLSAVGSRRGGIFSTDRIRRDMAITQGANERDGIDALADKYTKGLRNVDWRGIDEEEPDTLAEDEAIRRLEDGE